MRRYGAVSLLLLITLAWPGWPRHDAAVCGSSRETLRESLFQHGRIWLRHRTQPRLLAQSLPDAGNIAIVQDTGGVVDRQNQFNLDGATLTFTPAGAQYRYAVTPEGYDAAAASAGAPLVALDDDDSRQVALPFAFPFFGSTYGAVYVNSDGNLTFGAGDNASTQRSLGRMTAGPPRISPLFDDLNPAQTAGGVRVLLDATHMVATWVKVPEYSDSETGAPQTFQAALYADGRIDFSYAGVNPGSAVVGIAPGSLAPGTVLVDFLTDAGATYTAAVAEVFGNSLTVDVVTAAQQFYQTHEDSYDYLVIYNNMGIPALGEGTIAYEETLRNSGTGYGEAVQDSGQQFGSAARLQSVLNMGQLSLYPADPNAIVPPRSPQGDTPLTVLTHEAGHRFLAYASVKGAPGQAPLPMLGFQLAHWSFLFDSEASVMEGERIADRGSTASPEFLTTDITQAYAPLDQYLMGFRDASEVPDVFVVNHPSPNYGAAQHQFSGIGFNGTRQNITVQNLIAGEGRRTPDSTVAQRRFRFGFILVVAQGTQPSAADLAKLDAFRQQFETFYAQAASGRASADTTLRRSLQLSLFPAAGIVAGRTSRAWLTVSTPPAANLTVQLAAPNGFAQMPAQVTIPAGSSGATFQVLGVKPGVENVQAIPADFTYETAFARVQVADGSQLELVGVSPSSVRLTDANNLPYPGAGIVATPSLGGVVVPAEAYADANGVASFQWTPGTAPVNHLNLSVDGQPGVSLTFDAGAAVPVISSVVNAASLAPGVAPGSLAIINGSNLAGAAIALGGATVTPIFSNGSQILFQVPVATPVGAAALLATLHAGPQAAAQVDVTVAAPGIFAGGVRQVGRYLEIYGTGLGSPTGAVVVFIGAVPVQPSYAGPAPGLVGVDQVNVLVPASVAPGAQTLMLSVDSFHGNAVNITVQ